MTAQHPPRGLVGRLAKASGTAPVPRWLWPPAPAFRQRPGAASPERVAIYDARNFRGRPVKRITFS